MTEKPVRKKRMTKNQFKKGQSGNPAGRPKMTAEQKALAYATRSALKNVLNLYITMTPTQLKKVKRSPNTSAFERGIIVSILNIMESGSQAQMDWFLDKVLGKEKDVTNINLHGSMENTNKLDLSKCTAEELLILKKVAEKNEAEKS